MLKVSALGIVTRSLDHFSSSGQMLSTHVHTAFQLRAAFRERCADGLRDLGGGAGAAGVGDEDVV